MYNAFVTRFKNLRKHSNADRVLCGECFGNTVIVGLDTQPDELGVYFPVDGQLGVEFAQKNDLLRRKDENGNPAGGYLDPEKRNIKALKLRGEKSDGLFMPLSSLADFTDISQLKEGDTITQLNGVTICEKYIPVRKKGNSVGAGNRTRKRKDPISPLFMEHADTEQLPYNLSAFHQGDLVIKSPLWTSCCAGLGNRSMTGDMSLEPAALFSIPLTADFMGATHLGSNTPRCSRASSTREKPFTMR